MRKQAAMVRVMCLIILLQRVLEVAISPSSCTLSTCCPTYASAVVVTLWGPSMEEHIVPFPEDVIKRQMDEVMVWFDEVSMRPGGGWGQEEGGIHPSMVPFLAR